MITSLKTVAYDFGSAFLNLLYPRRCQICDIEIDYRNGSHLCRACFDKIKFNRPPFCGKCGRPLSETAHICSECRDKTLYFTRAYSVCIYEGIIKECIHRFKYNAKLQLAADLSKIMIDFVKNYFTDIRTINSIVPVPLYKTKQRERRFNQSHILAGRLGRYFNLPLNCGSLIKIKYTLPQIELSKIERLKNLENAFKIRKPAVFFNKNILLIDDVLTTLTTANECARALKEAGAKQIFVLSLARGA